MFAVVSDIHSNLEAFEAVLADMDQRGVDRVMCLGDIVGYGPNPYECMDLAADRCDVFVCGNHDHAVMYEPYGFHNAAESAAYWTRNTLEQEPDRALRDKRWDLLGRMKVRHEEGIYLFVHASPRRPFNEYVFMDDVFANPEKVRANFDRMTKQLCFIGHTHTAGVFIDNPPYHDSPEDLPDPYIFHVGKGKAIVNVGSVGQPRDRDMRASYVTVDNGTITWHRVEYDRAGVVEKIMHVPELDNYLGERLYDGR